jgi:hypothetical protein
VEQVRGENPYTVFTNAGDGYEKGSITGELSQGRTTRQVVQAMQYDVRAPSAIIIFPGVWKKCWHSVMIRWSVSQPENQEAAAFI